MKLSILIPIRAKLFYPFRYETPCMWPFGKTEQIHKMATVFTKMTVFTQDIWLKITVILWTCLVLPKDQTTVIIVLGLKSDWSDSIQFHRKIRPVSEGESGIISTNLFLLSWSKTMWVGEKSPNSLSVLDTSTVSRSALLPTNLLPAEAFWNSSTKSLELR